ncbi:MAG: hypothetical protein P8174_09115, partial [Gemmatimonadota bacterium]
MAALITAGTSSTQSTRVTSYWSTSHDAPPTPKPTRFTRGDGALLSSSGRLPRDSWASSMPRLVP